MKQLMKLSFVFIMVALFSTVSFAQENKRQGMSKDEKVKMKVERMKTELNLSEDQSNRIEAIYTEHFQSAEKDGYKKNHEEMQQKVKAVLTAEQAEKYEALKAERKSKYQHKRKMNEKRGHSIENRKESPTN